jgi:GrpB-like predicted nucleotidyltransferase (UPF0157 family)
MAIEMTCPTCGSHDISKNGMTRRGKQNHKCRDCGRQFVEDPQWQPKDKDTIGLVNLLLLEKIPLAGPAASLGRIEHFGSTAIPGLVAKPVIDVLVEVFSLPLVRQAIAPQLEAQGYDYLWRPTTGDDGPPFYAWFIKRNEQGIRTHHIHMVEPDFPHWARLQFRDWLRTHPETAQAYGELKQSLAAQFPRDRIAYTEGKTAFIQTVMAQIQAASSP